LPRHPPSRQDALSCIDRVLEYALGRDSVRIFFGYLQRHFGLAREQILQDPERFFDCLEQVFGSCTVLLLKTMQREFVLGLDADEDTEVMDHFAEALTERILPPVGPSHRPKTTSLTEALEGFLGLKSGRLHFTGLLIGPPGSGKSVICKQLAFEHLERGGNVFFVLTDARPAKVLEEMARFGWRVEKYVGRQLRFVDLCSWQIDGKTNFEETEYGFRACPLNEMDLKIAARQILDQAKEVHAKVIVDSLTSIMSQMSNARSFIRAFNTLTQEMNDGMASLDSGVHSREDETYMRQCHSVNSELKMETEPSLKRYMRISRFEHGPHPEDLIPFTITSEGAELEFPHGLALGGFRHKVM